MRFLRRLRTRFLNFVAGRSTGERLREEMEQHIALQTAENLRAGMAPDEARRQAVLKFGAVGTVREDYHAEQGLPFFENLIQDLRYALRMFAKSPGFSSIAILTMALGIGATTAVFSLVDATLLHPLSYPQPQELVRFQEDFAGAGVHDIGTSIPELWDLQGSGIFQQAGLQLSGSTNLTGSSQPARIQLEVVTPAYFTLLGVKPETGRIFDPNDKTPGFNLEVVISDGLWKRAFGSDPHILGRSLRLDNDLYHVIGVMPPGFHDPGRTPAERNTDVWAAAGFFGDPAPPPGRSTRLPVQGMARLRPGLTVAEAQRRLDALVANLQKQYPGDYPADSRFTIGLTSLRESVVGNVRQSLILLLSAVVLVLLIGCVNVANLLLARAHGRAREFAVRQALGAGRKRLVRQLLTESLLLSFLGGVAGIMILVSLKGFLLRLIPDSLPRLNDISISWSVLLVAVVASLAAGAIFGLAPAWQTARVNLTGALRQESRGSTGSTEQIRTRRALVVTEFALSLVLMIAAGLLLHSFWDLYRAPLGFNPERVMAVHSWLPIPNDPKTDIYAKPAQEAPFLREVLRRARLLPGVEQAAIGQDSAVPLNHDPNPFPFILEGRPSQHSAPPQVERTAVTPEYFHLLAIPLERGRLFTNSDDENAPQVAVINQAMARTYWPGDDPIGKRFTLNPRRQQPAWITVVGIVTDARTESLEQRSVPLVYLSSYQVPDKELVVFLRGHLDLVALPDQVRDVIQSVNPELPVYGAQTLDEAVTASLAQRRFSMQIVAIFAATALLLAALGIYGTISFLVSERTREIGVRLALGASRGAILAMVLRQGLALAVAGAALGLSGALILSRLMAGLLYGVTPHDPLTFIGVTLVLSAVALLACYIPARRAMRVDPLVALHYE